MGKSKISSMERERNYAEFRQVAELRNLGEGKLMLEVVTGRSGVNYLITGVTEKGLEATVVDYITYGIPEKVILPNDAHVSFANIDALSSRYPERLKRLNQEAVREMIKREIFG